MNRTHRLVICWVAAIAICLHQNSAASADEPPTLDEYQKSVFEITFSVELNDDVWKQEEAVPDRISLEEFRESVEGLREMSHGVQPPSRPAFDGFMIAGSTVSESVLLAELRSELPQRGQRDTVRRDRLSLRVEDPFRFPWEVEAAAQGDRSPFAGRPSVNY